MKRAVLLIALAAAIATALIIVYLSGRETPEHYAKSGAVVAVQNTVYNLDKLERYFAAEPQENDTIRIVRYTVEGDPIVMDIAYGQGVYWLAVDVTKDRFSAKELAKNTYTNIGVAVVREGRSFVLYNDLEAMDSENADDYIELLWVGEPSRLIE